MQRHILIEIRTCATSQTLHSRSRDAVCRALGLDIAFAVCDKGVFFRRSHSMSVSSLIAAAACALGGRV